MRLSRRSLIAGLATGWVTCTLGQEPRKPARPTNSPAAKAVLVELFTSQGCDLCPKAEQLLGQLSVEFGPDRVAPVAFHVDYFNDPWRDPFSNPAFSQREMHYSRLYTRAHNIDNQSYLYLTPLLMIDGRVPMVASNTDSPARARAAIREALNEPAQVLLGVDLNLDLQRVGRGVLRVSAETRPGAALSKGLLLEVVLCEDGLTTDVQAGELKGRAYSGSAVARRFLYRSIEPQRGRTIEESFDLELGRGQKPEQSSVVVFVQDEETGRVIQTRRVAWLKADATGRETKTAADR